MDKKIKIIKILIGFMLIIILFGSMLSHADSVYEGVRFLLILILVLCLVLIEMYVDITQKQYRTLNAIIITELIQIIIIVGMMILVVIRYTTIINLTVVDNILSDFKKSILLLIFYGLFGLIRACFKNEKFRIK